MLEITDDVIIEEQEEKQVDDEKQWCVYMHINNVNRKKYIGITSQDPEDRWKNGKGYKSQTVFWNAVEKYGFNRCCIGDCCRGKQKSAGKHPITDKPLHWKYVYDQIGQW